VRARSRQHAGVGLFRVDLNDNRYRPYSRSQEPATMRSFGGAFARGSSLILSVSALLFSAAPCWAGVPVPAPLVGVTGPFGLLAAGAAYGGYLLFKRFRGRA
jgi:hypothetical protein